MLARHKGKKVIINQERKANMSSEPDPVESTQRILAKFKNSLKSYFDIQKLYLDEIQNFTELEAQAEAVVVTMQIVNRLLKLAAMTEFIAYTKAGKEVPFMDKNKMDELIRMSSKAFGKTVTDHDDGNNNNQAYTLDEILAELKDTGEIDG